MSLAPSDIQVGTQSLTDCGTDTKGPLRREMRHRRQSLSPEQQARATQRLCRHLANSALFVRSQHLALYWPNDGEIDPRPLAERAWSMGKHCYLPILHPTQPRRLWFGLWEPEQALTPNRFGIPEPPFKTAQRLAADQLSLVLMPLVAFDRTGGRLGMGGGFYDRTFAFKRQWNRGPKLLGLAHSCQEVEALTPDAWDIPVDAVVTDQGWIG